jgi:glucose-6-phosphate isomerase
MSGRVERIRTFAEGVRRDGFTDVVLLGMGGSSLAPEVLRAVVGVAPGWPRFQMLDSTDPAAVRAAATPPDRTLYLLASKSGSTIEPNSLAAHFQARLRSAGIAAWGRHFVAITDEGTELAERAAAERFRDVFINPSDIGGRYSALSFFGLVPAALMGQDVSAILGWGEAMLAAATAEPDALANPAGALGVFMAVAARRGRDKLTLSQPPPLEPFGLWVEQLVAESTGKNGVGVIPIAGEPLASPDRYGSDRLFVRMAAAVDRLAPAVSIDLPESTAIGAEFMRWEIATAVAGALLGINPFDEPNVQQAKDATRALLDAFKRDGRLPLRQPDLTTPDGVSLTLSRSARARLGHAGPDEFLSVIAAGDYFGLLAYLGPDRSIAEALHTFRVQVRDRTRAATMFGYGPRYLHSTGQLHKGGPNTGVLVIVTATPTEDIAIPGEPYSFGTLELAQALGDFNSLDDAGRRALHVHLPSPDAALLRQVASLLTGRVTSSS